MFGVQYLSLADRRGHQNLDSMIMAVRAFFDGSGANRYDFLACRAASEKIWKIIEQKWMAILADHFKDKRLCVGYEVVDLPYLHMKEAMHLQELFCAKNGWDREKVIKLVADLIEMLNHFSPRNL